MGKNHEDSRHSLWTGRVASMVADNSDASNGTVHVMTTDPLTLHSFANLGATADAMRGSTVNPSLVPQLVKRELLSEDMSYRLGSMDPLLIPLNSNCGHESGASCAVLIPDLSMALVVNKDPEVPVQMLSIPLKSFGQATSSKYKEVVRMFGGNSSSHSLRGHDFEYRQGHYAACSSIDAPGHAILYRSGGQGGEIHLLDFNSDTIRTVDIATALLSSHPDDAKTVEDIGIQSITSLGDGNWTVVSSASGSDDASIPRPNQFNHTRSIETLSQSKLKLSVMSISREMQVHVRPMTVSGEHDNSTNSNSTNSNDMMDMNITELFAKGHKKGMHSTSHHSIPLSDAATTIAGGHSSVANRFLYSNHSNPNINNNNNNNSNNISATNLPKEFQEWTRIMQPSSASGSRPQKLTVRNGAVNSQFIGNVITCSGLNFDFIILIFLLYQQSQWSCCHESFLQICCNSFSYCFILYAHINKQSVRY